MSDSEQVSLVCIKYTGTLLRHPKSDYPSHEIEHMHEKCNASAHFKVLIKSFFSVMHQLYETCQNYGFIGLQSIL